MDSIIISSAEFNDRGATSEHRYLALHSHVEASDQWWWFFPLQEFSNSSGPFKQHCKITEEPVTIGLFCGTYKSTVHH